MINRLLYAAACVLLTGAMVILGMAWGRFVGPSTSVDTNAALQMALLVGMLLIYPSFGLLRSRRR